MNEQADTKRGWRVWRRILTGLAIFATLIAIFYTEENWRGKRAWEACRREYEARGVVFDWSAYIPPTVPDDQNFFKAPDMTEWFVKGEKDGGFGERLKNTNNTTTITAESTARDYLAWSDQFQPQFDQVREALKRPYARMDGDYNAPLTMPVPNFVTMRLFAQIQTQRAKCHLLLNQPDKALEDLTLLNDSCRLLEGAPTGKPMTLVAAMINVAIRGIYVDAIAAGTQRHIWQEPQLAALQSQLEKINLLPIAWESLCEQPIWGSHVVDMLPIAQIFDVSGVAPSVSWMMKLFPRGWVEQNRMNFVRATEEPLDGFDLPNNTISPRVFNRVAAEAWQASVHRFPFKIFLAVFVPNMAKVAQTVGHHQTLVQEGQIACALERYRLANGDYPETLEALMPQFLEKIPHDLIGGQPLHYRRMADGKFLLYSVGWNETDDGGQRSPAEGKNDYTQGDWVWKN